MPPIRITGATLLPPEGVALPEAKDIWIRDGRIAALLPPGAPAPFDEPVETLAFAHALAIPGMINAHTHSASALLRGTNPGLPVDLYALEAASRRAPRTARHVRVATLLQAVEMQKHGVTGVVDHLRHGAAPDPASLATVFEAYGESGMRATVAPIFDDRPFLDALPIDRAALPPDVRERWEAKRPPAAEDYFAAMEEIVKEWHGRDRFRVLIGIEGPPRSSPRAFALAGDFAARHGIGLHTHLLEAKTQGLMAGEDYGGSFVAYLDRFGLIGPQSSLAHFVWCTDRDIALAAERRVNIVHNPTSNLLLGSGLLPAARLMAAGVNVALGTDGAGGAPIDVLEQARMAMLLSRIAETDCNCWITARQAVDMATKNGAAVLGEREVGAIAVGARADLVLIDLRSQVYRPMGDIWNHLVMYEKGAGVDTVLIDGKIVVRHGKCAWIDEDALLAEADAMAAEARPFNADALAGAKAERAAFEPLILKALDRDDGVERFARLR